MSGQTPQIIALLVAFAVITMIGIRNRLWGAILTLVFVIGVSVYGHLQLQAGAKMRFFFIDQPEIYYVAIAGFIGFSLFRVQREWKRSR